MSPPPHRSRIGLPLGAALLLALAAITVACIAVFRAQVAAVDLRLREREAVRIETLVQTLRSSWVGVFNDLRGLIEGDGLQAYLTNAAPDDLARAQRRAAFFARLHRSYAQLRFVDRDGREVFRAVNSDTAGAPVASATDEDRTLLSLAAALGDGELLITAPRKSPTGGQVLISFAMPVLDQAGHRRGYYFIDCHGPAFIEHLRAISSTLRHRLRLLDSTGHWLAAAQPAQDWSLGATPTAAPLPQSSPETWAAILHATTGQQTLGGGLLTWRRLSTVELSGPDLPRLRLEEPFLVLASVVSESDRSTLLAEPRWGFFISVPLLLVLTATCAWLWRSHQNSVRSLRRSEQDLAVTLDSIGDAVLATDTEGRITQMNPIAEQLTGWRLAEARGRPIGEVFRVIHSGTCLPAEIPVSTVLATGRRESLERDTVLVARDGTELPIADSAAPIRETSGLIRGVVLVFRDATSDREWETVQSRFSAIIESTEDAILTKTLDGTITSWNPAAARMFGHTAGEAIGRSISLILPPDLIEEDDRARQEAVSRRVAVHLETRRLRRDGSTFDVAITLSPLAGADGMVSGVSSIIRDVTRAHQAAEQLRRSAAEVRDLYNNAPCGYHSLDADGRFVAINDTELAWLGYRREEIVGRLKITDVLTEEGRAVFHELYPRFKREGAVHNLELRFRRRDGSVFHGLINATGIFDAAGNFVSSRSTLFDITARKEAEQELERFFAISLDFLCISSGDGFFKRVSPAVTDILGWTVEEFLARPYTDFVHPDDLEATLREVERQLLRGEKVFQFENRYLHKDGTWRILSWRSTPQPGGLMYASARDVTENRRSESEVRRLHQVLETHAARLELANKELEAFSYSVSHDLRAPLRHIRGYAEMLHREAADQLSDKSRRYLGVINDAAREMSQLIDDLLQFSRMSRTDLHETALDLNPVVAAIRQDLTAAQPERAIEWRIASLPRVLGDPAMLRQVLVNLLGNAVKYSRPRTPAVIEFGVNGTDDSGRLILFVRDNGVGFDMRYADKLFGVFQRLHRADEFEGTGIGLASVQRILVRHGGRIWAESRPDAGATFYFTLRPAPTATAPTSP